MRGFPRRRPEKGKTRTVHYCMGPLSTSTKRTTRQDLDAFFSAVGVVSAIRTVRLHGLNVPGVGNCKYTFSVNGEPKYLEYGLSPNM